jgi:hypothetical protein
MSSRGEMPAAHLFNPTAVRRLHVSRRSAVLAALFVAIVIAGWMGRAHQDLIDFDVDYRAGQRLLHGEDLARPEDGHFVYKYLPGAAILEDPLYATYEALMLTTVNFLVVVAFTAALRFKRVC